MRLIRRPRERGTRLFYAADLHGSEVAWRKFVNAAEFYKVDALVFGGDLMGKALLPIVREGSSYRASFFGRDEVLEESELPAFVRRVETAGYYWGVLDADEYALVREDALRQKTMFHELASERLRRWLAFAEERLPRHVRLYVTGGNDDEPSVLEELERHDGSAVVACEGEVVDLDEEHTMITVGLSTYTPWDTPREASEGEIARAIEKQAANVPDLSRAVFNLHCPPKDSSIDTCLKLKVVPGELPQPIRSGGRFLTTGGGSSAVREAIRRHQPVVGLHGHIHESPGRYRIGRTPCFNPGSEYGQGRLQGWIVELSNGRVGTYQYTSG